MKPSHIEHIGIAVTNLQDSISVFEKLLGVACAGVEEVPDEKVRTAFFLLGQTKIELLESISSDGPISRFIEKRGEGLHHVALAVEDVRATLGELEAQGLQLIDREPRQGAEGLLIAFVHPRSTHGVLIELCEDPVKGYS